MVERFSILLLIVFWLFMPEIGLSQSVRPGWGATPYAGVSGTGVTFRVWAPNASSIHVFGNFNSWNTNNTPLIREIPTNSGVWSVDVPAARPGHEFKYSINNSFRRRDPRARQVIHSGEAGGIIYDPAAYEWNVRQFQPPAVDDLVVYEMHIGTFYDPNPNDGVSGTFYDAIQKLDTVAALGANAVQLMPVAEFAGNNSWGYNPSDPFAVESAYGGPDGLKAFVDACHERGLAVLLDVVHNHYGPSDLENSLWQFDGWAGAFGGGIYFFQENIKSQTKWGPRPDYSRPQVRNYIRDNTRMWIEEYQVDGFRWDATLYMRFATNFSPIAEGAQMLREVGDMMAMEFPDKIHIAEDHVLDGLVTSPLTNGLGFNSEWIRSFHEHMTAQITNDTGRNLEVIAGLMTYTNGSRRLIYIESHDESGDHNAEEGALRFPAEISPTNPAGYVARKKSTMAAALMMASPGIPMVFQGQEMLEHELFSDLNPVDWTKTNTHSGTVRLYQDIIGLKRNRGGVTAGLSGSFTSTSVTNNGTLLLVRRGVANDPTNDVFVIANLSTNYVEGYWLNFPTNGTWYTHFNSDSSTYNTNYQSWGSTDVFAWEDLRGNPYIAPWSVLVLSRHPHSWADTDRDGMPDSWENTFSLNPLDPSDAWKNPDEDYYSNVQEFRAGTSPVTWNKPKSNFDTMSVVGDFTGWNPSLNNMAPIADYLWQRDLAVTGTNIQFKFAANNSWDHNWGIISQSLHRMPITHAAKYFSDDNIVLTNMMPGVYRFSFDEKRLRLSVRSIAIADSDADGLPDSWEISNGLNPINPADRYGNPDGDLYHNTEEFKRGYSPIVWNKPLTDYNTMAVLGTYNNWQLPGSYMQQVTNQHYTWSLVTNLFVTGGIQFKFSANGGLARVWALNGQNQAEVPFTNTATYLGNWNIVVTQNLNGAYRFTMNEQTRVFSMTSADTDTDGDGLPDWWELQYFGNITNALASGSPDGDIYSNLFEYRSLMNPSVYDLPDANYSAMGAVGSFNNWNPAANMSLVDHHTWQYEQIFTNAVNPEFKFAANGGWDDNWGHSVSSPLTMTGTASKNQANNNMQILGTINGPLVFTFNDETFQYSVAYNHTFTEMDGGFAHANPGAPFVIRWSSNSNQLYRLLRGTNLFSAFTVIAPSLPATPPINVYTDAVPSSASVFYQIMVNP